ncbi:HAD family hydrolase [bacterium]|nr:HAD family hydrolase [bacterium]
MKLLLFDIDGTLLLSGGAGRTAMNRTFHRLYGFENGFRDISMMGRTDPLILRDVMQQHGISIQDGDMIRFQETYYGLLEQELEHADVDKRLCPGILELLERLNQDKQMALGLLTGNWRRGAFLKLRHFQIDHFFRLGAYADDEAERVNLVPVAMNRFRDLFGHVPAPEDVYVIGDTPLDIRAARPHGVRTVAVATGFHEPEILKVENPDVLFESFEQVDSVIAYFNT